MENTFCTKCGQDIRRCKCPDWKDERIKALEAENANILKDFEVLREKALENEALKRRVEELEKLIEYHKTDTHDAMEWKNQLQSQLQEAREIIKHIHCECCIGNPMVGKHDDYCIKAKAWMGKYGSHV